MGTCRLVNVETPLNATRRFMPELFAIASQLQVSGDGRACLEIDKHPTFFWRSICAKGL
jgi:hypothetical protein